MSGSWGRKLRVLGTYTLRGNISETVTGLPVRLCTLDDADIKTAFRCVSFVIASSSGGSSQDWAAKLMTVPEDRREWDWEKSTEFAWAATDVGTSAIRNWKFELVDPNVLLMDEIWCHNSTVGTTTEDMCYYIELEKVAITEDQAVLTRIRERSQGGSGDY